MGKLDGKVAIVTGGAAGIGRATALLFAQEGAKVMVADVDEEKGREVTTEIGRTGGTAIFVKVDVSQPSQVEAMVREAVETYGRLDVLFNNAGIEGAMAPTADYPLEEWDRVIATNLKGVFLGMKYGIPAMLKSGGGTIINTASTAGLVGWANMPAYTASKGGVLQLTKTAALEYAQQGIRVNAICPGGIMTPLVERIQAAMGMSSVPPEQQEQFVAAVHPVGRMGQPEEVARLALFLASDDSSFCTGAPFVVDGGQVAQ